MRKDRSCIKRSECRDKPWVSTESLWHNLESIQHAICLPPHRNLASQKPGVSSTSTVSTMSSAMHKVRTSASSYLPSSHLGDAVEVAKQRVLLWEKHIPSYRRSGDIRSWNTLIRLPTHMLHRPPKQILQSYTDSKQQHEPWNECGLNMLLENDNGTESILPWVPYYLGGLAIFDIGDPR